MGQGQTHHSHPVLDSNWLTITNTPNLFSHVNPYANRTLRNINDHTQIEEYLIDFASEYDFRRYAEQLRVRIQPSNNHIIQQNSPDSYYNLSPYVYTVKYFVNNTLQELCATVYRGLLYAKKVDLRLKEINDIPLSDQLYLTKATLQGFKLLYQRVGYFDITEQMIFISKEGKVKVWINCDLSKNEPLYIPNVTTKDAHGSQSDMLVQLLDLIQQNSDDHEQQGIHFKQYLTKKGIYNRLSFHRALDEFEAYCMEEHMAVESSMKSIYELYYQEQDEHSDVMEMEERRNYQPTAMHQPSEDKLGNGVSAGNQMSLTRLQLPISQSDNFQLNASRASKQSERQSRQVDNVEGREDTNRARSTTGHAYKVQEISFNHSTTHVPINNEQSKVAKQQQHNSINYANLPQQRRQVIRSQPTATYGLPPLNPKTHQRPIESAKPAVISFNYVPHHNSNPTNSRTYQQVVYQTKPAPNLMPHNLVTVKSIQTQSRDTARQINQHSVQELIVKSNAPSINYYSPDETYTLDREIAEDLQKYLGYNLSS